MIAAETTLQAAASKFRDFLEYLIALIVLLAERWNRLILSEQDSVIAEQPADKKSLPRPQIKKPADVAPYNQASSTTEGTEQSALVRRPPRQTAAGTKLPRTMSTRKAVHLDARAHAHRRCTSSSGVTTTTSTSAIPSFAAKLQPPMNARPTHGSLNEREALAVALRCAVVRKEVRSVRALLEDNRELVAHILTNWSDPSGSSIIHSAAATADPAVVAEVLAHVSEADMKAVVNCKGPQNQTALHIACTKQALPVCEMLLAKGADPNSCTKLDTTPLHLATGVGDYELCKVLLSHGAEVNCLSKVGNLPILTAVGLGEQRIVKLLLEYGADPKMAAPQVANDRSIPNQDGSSAEAMAMRMNEKKIMENIDEVKT